MEKKEKEIQGQKKKVEDFSKELKEFSDEQQDQVAGGFTGMGTGNCSLRCKWEPLQNVCKCPPDVYI